MSLLNLIRKHVRLIETTPRIQLLKTPGVVKRYYGLCPFHDEVTPSFTCAEDMFVCISCGAEGHNELDFMRHKKALKTGVIKA